MCALVCRCVHTHVPVCVPVCAPVCRYVPAHVPMCVLAHVLCVQVCAHVCPSPEAGNPIFPEVSHLCAGILVGLKAGPPPQRVTLRDDAVRVAGRGDGGAAAVRRGNSSRARLWRAGWGCHPRPRVPVAALCSGPWSGDCPHPAEAWCTGSSPWVLAPPSGCPRPRGPLWAGSGGPGQRRTWRWEARREGEAGGFRSGRWSRGGGQLCASGFRSSSARFSPR